MAQDVISYQKPLKRLKRKLTIENIWIYILSLLKEKPMYAYEINKRLNDRFKFEPGKVTAYVTLYKLELSGYVRPEWRDAGRQRKYYHITEAGDRLLKEGVEFIEEQIEKIRSKGLN